jgi:signal transduction histidine kinase
MNARGTGASMETPAPKQSLQHALNNPIAGLLAELQLLEMDDLTDSQRGGVERSIALVRRLITIVREQVPND